VRIMDVAYYDLVEGKNLVGLSPADTVRANELLSSELEIASRRPGSPARGPELGAVTPSYSGLERIVEILPQTVIPDDIEVLEETIDKALKASEGL
jgi:hypothetical protein